MQLQTSTLHFDLTGLSGEHEYRLLNGVKGGILLSRYADHPAKLDEHRSTNEALAALPEDQLRNLTHFVEAVHLPARGTVLRRVVFPSLDDHPLPEIAMVFPHVGGHDVVQAVHRLPAYHAQARHHLALSSYGVPAEALAEMSRANYAAIHKAAAAIKPPGVTAQSLVLSHPEIGTVNGVIAKYVLDTYVSQGLAFSELIQYIQQSGPGTPDQWYNKSWVKWAKNDDGTGDLVPAEVNTGLTFSDGQTPDWPTPPGGAAPGMPSYSLTDEYEPPVGTGAGSGVVGAAAPVVQQVLLQTKDDDTLNGQLWSKQSGTTDRGMAHSTTRATRPLVAAVAETPAATGFAVKNVTSSYGLWVYDDEMKWNTSTRQLSLPVKNWPARCLGAYVQFLKSDGTPIARADITAVNPADPAHPFTWKDNIPFEFLRPIVERSATKNYLTYISSGAQIFGAPTPFLTQQTDLAFLWPDDASSAQILLGGLGCASGFSDWDTDVDLVGTLMTGIMNYGVGTLALVANVYVVNPLLKMLQEEWGDFAFYTMCGVIGAPMVIVGGFEHDTSMGKFILSKLSSIVVGGVFGAISSRVITATAQKVATMLADAAGELAAEITAEEALEQVPVAGWALKIASIAADLASLTATTVECVLSPATYDLNVQRSMTLTITVTPDPAHGTNQISPVWPLVSDHYQVQVTYPSSGSDGGGTTYTKSGPMPAAHDAPIVVKFDGIPAGGKIKVTGNIYSDNNWLCGVWNSGWINAVPDDQDQLTAGGAIKEQLVPLTSTSTYIQKQTLGYLNQKHSWIVTRFTLDSSYAASLDSGGAPSQALISAFAAQGNAITSAAKIAVATPGAKWTLADPSNGASYGITLTTIAPDQTELTVQSTSNAAPPMPSIYPMPTGPTGNELGPLQNIIHNNQRYQLGYAWMASGQNLPLNDGTTPQNVPMYAMQSISTLGEPELQIIEPALGFSLSTLIAYDQFGLAELFPLPASLESSLVAGPVADSVAQEFAGFGRTLPPGCVVVVIGGSAGWTIGQPNTDPLYQLAVVADTDGTKHIGVYAWPIPAMDNFYLDPRGHSDENPVYYLRGVDLSQPPGQHEFDYDTTMAWGRISNAGSLQGLAVHPQGYVVAVDFVNHKLFTLKLPAQALASDSAPWAMPLSGAGIREGLMKNPQALTITTDGRILVLEQGNMRVQAFDVKGNSVPCFSVGQPSFALPASFAAELDAHTPGTDLLVQFLINTEPALAPKVTISNPASIAKDLDASVVDQTFVDDLIQMGYAQSSATGAQFTVTTARASQEWLVADTQSGAQYDVRLQPDRYLIDHLNVYTAPTYAIATVGTGVSWTIDDTTNSVRYSVTKPPSGDMTVQQLVSYMPLRETTAPGINYLDIAVESKGYIYVLMAQKSGGAPAFSLDIYSPDGSPLLDKPQSGVNAARITVDQWRSLFTLNYNVVLGPNGRTEPGVSEWMPSTPDPATSV